MDFVTPKELSLKYNVSLKTIYNYVSKWDSKIKTRKEFWKTLISLNDFEHLFWKGVQNVQEFTNNESKNNNRSTLWTIENDFEELQKNYNLISQEKENLQNYNLALQEQATKYALLFNDEKNERKELYKKYEDLQSLHYSDSMKYEKEKANRQRNFFFLLWISLVVAMILIASNRIEIMNWRG